MKSILKTSIFTIAFLCMAHVAFTQLQGTHQPVQWNTVTPNLSPYYYEYLPPGYNPADTQTKYPLIMFFHGNGKRYSTGQEAANIEEVLDEGPPHEIDLGNDMCFRVNGIEQCFIVISPQLGPSGDWDEKVAEITDYVLDTYNVDLNKVYVTGLSLGGIASIDYAQNNTSPLWARTLDIAAIAVAPGGEPNLSTECLLPTRSIALWAAHRIDDPTDRTQYSFMQSFVDQINACSGQSANPPAYMTAIPGTSHNVWSTFYKTTHTSYFPNVYEWFLLNGKGTTNVSPGVPGVYAGPNQTVSLNTAQLNSSAGDNDPTGSIASYSWTKQSGPNTPTYSPNANAADPDVNNLVPGVYVFRVTVTDNTGKTQYDEVKITVTGGVTADAGGDKLVDLPTNNTTLNGSGTGSITSYAWTKTAGPSGSSFGSASSPTTTVTGLVAGNYTFRLTVTGPSGSAFDDVNVTVNPAPPSGTLVWHSYSINTQSSPSQQGIVTSVTDGVNATVEFYKSTNDLGVNKTNLFTTWNSGNHTNANAHAKWYWADAAGAAYPYAGKSTVGRGSDVGEGNAQSPSGVLDLQLHPPQDNKLTVAAFIAPVAGDYSISNLAVRRVSTNGTTVRFRVFNSSKVEVANIQATNNQDWVLGGSAISVGTLAAGDRLYFATDRDSNWEFDFTEVAFTISAGIDAPSEAQSWNSYAINTQAGSPQATVVGSGSTSATVELYKSTNDDGVIKGSLFTTYNSGNHTNANAHAKQYWADGSGAVYPFAGLSTVTRGNDVNETNPPSPNNVTDLQLHPPQDAKLTVAAFVVPVAGEYTVSNLGVRRVSPNGTTVVFKVFDNNQDLVTSLTANDNQAWVKASGPYSVGTLAVNDRIYFATDNDGDWAFDFTEVAFTINLLDGGGSGARMATHSNDDVVKEEPAREEPIEEYSIRAHDINGNVVKQFTVKARSSEFDEFNFRPYLNAKGFYVLQITKADRNVETKRFVFVD